MERQAQTPKLPRQKSPNAPAYSLQETLEDARKLFRIENQAPISRDSIAEHLSLAAQSGPFNRKLSSLRQYGLLEPAGKDLRVSDLFLRIDHAQQEPDRRHALREALARPTIFQAILSQYENTGGGMPSDLNLTNHLVLRFRFTKKNAETVAKAFLESARLAGLSQIRPFSPVSPPSPSIAPPLPTAPLANARPDLYTLDLPSSYCRQEIPLGLGRRATLTLPEDIRPEEIAKIVRILQALAHHDL